MNYCAYLLKVIYKVFRSFNSELKAKTSEL